MNEPKPQAFLFAEDLAARFHMPRQRAHRWLKWLEEKHGTSVVGQFPGRTGVRRFTTLAALEAITPAYRSKWAEFQGRLDVLETGMQRLESQMAALSNRTS